MAADEGSIGDWLSADPADVEEVAHRYDEWAESYNDDLASWRYQAPAVVAESVVTRRPDAGSLLDVGCGTGMVGKALRDRGYAGRLTGIDISEASLRLAEQTSAYDALQPADLQQPLELADDSFDVLVCVGVMTYLPGVEAAWREFARVVRPGGLVVLTQRDDLWGSRDCQAIVDRMHADGLWTQQELAGPAPYLPDGYGGTPEVACYYLTATVDGPNRTVGPSHLDV